MKERCYTIEDSGGENPGVLGRDSILEHIATLIDDDHILADRGEIKITIRRHDLTRQEIEALIEV